MEIDFHHSTTYVLSRMAGFSTEEAYLISYSSQYVDDAGIAFTSVDSFYTQYNKICFDNFQIFEFINTYRKSPNTIKTSEQNTAFVFFHFLPSAIKTNVSEQPTCKKAKYSNSETWDNTVAKILVEDLLKNVPPGDHNEGLYQLGVTLHVIADTFAHHRFSGTDINGNNEFRNIKVIQPENILIHEKSSMSPSLNHAIAERYSDIPFITWQYTNSKKETIIRDNPAEYMNAAKVIFEVLQNYRKKYYQNHSIEEKYISNDFRTIQTLIKGLKNKNGAMRNEEWIKRIRNGYFKSCPEGMNEKAEYFEERADGSWWSEVTKMCPISESPMWQLLGYRKYNKDFLTSKYKLFHNAIIHNKKLISKQLIPIFESCIL